MVTGSHTLCICSIRSFFYFLNVAVIIILIQTIYKVHVFDFLCFFFNRNVLDFISFFMHGLKQKKNMIVFVFLVYMLLLLLLLLLNN